MTAKIRLKALVAIVFVVAIGSAEWRTQAQSQPTVNSTLQAASENAVKMGVKTYRIQRPMTENGITTLTIDLLGSNPDKLGVVSSEQDIPKGTERQSIELGGRSLTFFFSKERVTITGNGREIYSGAFQARPKEESDAFRAEFGDLATLMGDAITTARSVIRRGQALAFSIQRQAASAPMLLRPIARTVYRWLPRPAVLFASPRMEDGPSCPQSVNGENEHCEWGWSSARSTACNSATEDANYECSNFYCLGCCAFSSDSCDCACIYDDFGCTCERCGYACRPPMIAPLQPVEQSERK